MAGSGLVYSWGDPAWSSHIGSAVNPVVCTLLLLAAARKVMRFGGGNNSKDLRRLDAVESITQLKLAGASTCPT